jgi:hypothetical protein
MAEAWGFPVINTIVNFFTRMAEAWGFPVINTIVNFFTRMAEAWGFPVITAILNFFTWLAQVWTFPVITTIGNFLYWFASNWTFPVLDTIGGFFYWLGQEWNFPVLTKIKDFLDWLFGLFVPNQSVNTGGGGGGTTSGHTHSYQYAGVVGMNKIWRCSCGAQYEEPIVGTYASGSSYVPRTGLALLHQGEAVIPAAQNRSGGAGGITININATINNETDIQVLAKRLGWYMQQEARFA